MTEKCMNPFKECHNTNIVLYIMYRGRKLPICESCWWELAEKDWNDYLKPYRRKIRSGGRIVISSRLARKAGFREGDTVTVYVSENRELPMIVITKEGEER